MDWRSGTTHSSYPPSTAKWSVWANREQISVYQFNLDLLLFS
jgi:hypothetical protein